MLVFGERGKPEYPGKTSHSRVMNQQTQPTYDDKSGNRTRATLVGGQCSHHCANSAVRWTPTLHIIEIMLNIIGIMLNYLNYFK